MLPLFHPHYQTFDRSSDFCNYLVSSFVRPLITTSAYRAYRANVSVYEGKSNLLLVSIAFSVHQNPLVWKRVDDTFKLHYPIFCLLPPNYNSFSLPFSI